VPYFQVKKKKTPKKHKQKKRGRPPAAKVDTKDANASELVDKQTGNLSTSLKDNWIQHYIYISSVACKKKEEEEEH
jgi:hypothetical protein